jgi:GPH family glycoside/pentoside/hexuronide:cation symporter
MLTLRRILLYNSASAGLNLMGITVSTWLLYFYSPPLDSGRTVYLPIALVGVLMTVTSLWDAVIDPFIGHFSDNLRWRWGRRRPLIFLAAPVAAVALVLLWMPPQGGTALTAVYFFIIVTLYYTTISMVAIPYDAALPEMAHTPREMIALTTWKSVLGILGVMAGALLAGSLLASLGPLGMGLVIGGVGLVTLWLALFGLRETEKPLGAPMPVLEGLRATLHNRQFAYMFISVLIVHIAYALTSANLPYFITLVLHRSESDVAALQGVLVGMMMLSAPLWNWLSRRCLHRKLLMLSMILLGLVLASAFSVGSIPFIPAYIQGVVTVGLVGPVLGGYFILVYAMMGSVVDYDETLTHARREAIYYGAFSLAASIGPSLAALILPLILKTFGYTLANPLGVRIAWLAAGLCSLLGALAFRGYRLGDTPEKNNP